MLLGWKGLGIHLLVELHAFRGGAFLGVKMEPEEKDGSSSHSSFCHHQMTNLTNFGEVVVDVQGQWSSRVNTLGTLN